MDIVGYLAQKHHIFLTDQQKQGVLSNSQNTLLLAVPGSGKTTVLTSRIADALANRGIPAERILTLTFSRETAQDMKRRFETLFSSLVPKTPRFSTIHSFCLSVLREYSRRYRRAMPRLILEENGLHSRILRELYRRYNGESLAEDSLDTLDGLIGRAKNLLLSREELRKQVWEISHFPDILADYETFKRENGWMDYDDMLTLCLEIFEKCPPVLKSVQQKFDEIYLDEAQDISLVQHRILSLVSRNSRMFMVGDEDQSIYGFRGAYPQALLSFSELYKNTSVIKMERNFRSHSDIIQAANGFIGQNRQRYAKNMYGGQEESRSMEWVRLSDYREQYSAVIHILKETDPSRKTAVLYRNNESALPLIDLLHRAGISYYRKEERFSFFFSGVIQDLEAYVRLAGDPCDLEAFSRIYYKLGCSRGVYDAVRERLREYGGVFDAVLSLTSLKPYRRKMIESYAAVFPRILKTSPGEALRIIRRDLGYDNYMERRLSDSSAYSALRQKLNIALLLAEGERDMNAFLEKLSRLQKSIEKGELFDPDSKIILSTFHSAKGMEFDTVILLDTVEGVLPAGNPGNREIYEEEVRLFYVGVTRARDRLVLFRANQWNGETARPSPFLDQLQGKKGMSSERTDKELPDLTGKRVYHVVFGEGNVLSQTGDKAVVEFRTLGKKELSLPICLENGILRVKS